MNYKIVELEVLNEDFTDILVAELTGLGFDGFEETQQKILAYIEGDLLNMSKVEELVERYAQNAKVSITSLKDLENKNWNEVWESNFKAVCIDDKIIIKAPFHDMDKVYPFTITIMPKMSFGTGHHETTALMLSQMLEMDFQDKTVFDYGCGTGILSIMASKLKAKNIFSIDIDNWAYVNTKENLQANQIENTSVHQGEIALVEGKKFDIILANINRNVILETFPALISCLNDGSKLLLSGLLTEDFDIVHQKALEFGLVLNTKKDNNNWIMLYYEHNE